MQPYKRVLLKLSGEALMGSQKSGIKPSIIKRIAQDISRVLDLDVEILSLIHISEPTRPY